MVLAAAAAATAVAGDPMHSERYCISNFHN